MENARLTLLGAVLFSLLVSTSAAAAPAAAAPDANPYAPTSAPVWATLNAEARGNYPGGNEQFIIFVVNSGQPPNGNVTVQNATLTAPALPAGQNSNTGIGLPAVLAPGQSIVLTIHLPIPSDFSDSNFTANLVAHASLWNGTANIPLTLTGSVLVYMLGTPGQSGSQVTTTTTTTVEGSGTVSTTLFAVGVAIPSIVAVILLILLARRRAPGAAPPPQ